MAHDALARSDADAILPVTLGTVVWLVVLVALLLNQPRLTEDGTLWWIGVAAVGAVTGAGGVVFLRWRRARAARREQRQE